MLLFALGTMLCAGACIYYFARTFEAETCSRYNEKQFEHVQGIARNLTEVLTLLQKDLEYLAAMPNIQLSDGQSAKPQLAEFYRRFDTHISDIGRIDAQGNFLATHKTGLERAGLSARHSPSTVQALTTQATALAGPFKALDGQYAVTIDVPVFRTDAKSGERLFTGTLSSKIEIDKWIENYVTPFDVQMNSFTWIINAEHKIVAHSNAALIGESWLRVAKASFIDPDPGATDRRVDEEFLTSALTSSRGGKLQLTLGSLGREPHLVAYAPLKVGGTQWIVVSNAPRRAVVASMNANLRNIWIVAVIFGGLLIIITFFALRAEQNKVWLERELRQNLQQSEKKYRMLIERSNDGILLVSPDGFIKLVNKRFAEMLGRSEEELLGQNIRDFVPIEQRAMIEREWRQRLSGVSSSYELELYTARNARITVIASESPVFNRNNEHIGNLSVLTDITEKKHAEEEIRHQNEELTTINTITETANQSLILEEIFHATTRKIKETLKLDGCLIASINDKARTLSVTASVGFTDEFLTDPHIQAIPIGMGYAGRSAETGELVIVEDLSVQDGSLGERPSLEAVMREGITSAAFVPIKVRDSVYGIIACASRSLRGFSEQDIRLLSTIGQTIGIAVEKANLYQNARHRAMRLETIYQVSDKMTALVELDELLPALVKLIHDTFNYYNVNLFLFDKETGTLVFTAGCGGFRLPEPLGARITPPDGIVGSCFHCGEPILVDDVHQEPNFMYIESLPETKSELAVPLLARGNAIGVLDVQSSYYSAFDEEDVLTLQVLAELIGVAVENSQLYEKIKHSLDEVRKSQAFFAKIVLESPLSTFITDASGTCILINQSALALLRPDLIYDEVVGKYNLLNDPPFVGTAIAEKVRAVMAGEVVQFNVDLPAPMTTTGTGRLRRDTVFLRATLFPLMDDTGKVANIVAMFEDLTEKKVLEETLVQAQKMESIGTLAGGIAHDFNNILGGVLGYTSFIKTKMSKTDPLFRYINIIESSARRAADLTQQLLAFARGGKYRVQTLDLNQVVKEAVDLIARSIDKNISLALDLEPNLPSVEGDGGQIIQTIVNMCINARDAMPEGGRLDISTRVTEITEDFIYTHPGAKLGTYVLLTVGDTGIGMGEETKQRIFEPFFTTKKDKKGTGLGLAMVYGIVKNHGGYIDVESEVGVGTNFQVYLPISEKKIEQPEKPAITKQLCRGSETILVAEDEELMRDLIVEMLDSGGYQVIPAENGREALDIYRQRAREIDLVILDMIMPELGGHEAFRQLKQINPQVKVLLSSGYSQDGQAQQIMSEGVLGFIQKPYAVNELLDKIRYIIDRN